MGRREMDRGRRARRPERRGERRGAAFFWLVFPAALLYYETALRLFTAAAPPGWDVLAAALMCCAYGGFGYLLCTLSGSSRVNFWLAEALLFVTAVPFVIEAFLYRQFKIFYDFGAVFAGAGDVMDDFSGEIVRLVFSARGLLCIGVYLLPVVLFGFFGAVPGRLSGRQRGMTAARMAAFYLLGWAVIQLTPSMRLLYGEEYDFQSSVERFGLVTGARLDAKRGLLGDGGSAFQQVDMTRIGGVPSPSPSPTAEPAEETGQTEGTAPAPSASPSPSPTPKVRSGPLDNGLNQLDLPLDEEVTGWISDIEDINAYVATLTPSAKNEYTGLFEGKNLIMITAEAFSKEAIDPERTPTLYRMYTKGVNFTDYYQFGGAGTTGGEYQHIFGLLPSDGINSMLSMTGHKVLINMPTALNARGYYGKAYHNNTYTYYDRDKTHPKLGFSDGYMGFGNGIEEFVTGQWPESDYEMFTGTVPTYIDRQPFNIYYMTVSGHASYGRERNAMARKNWDRVADLPYSNTVKGYLAANLELEDSMTYLIGELEKAGIADDTVICITPDHYPYGLDDDGGYCLQELYGYPIKTIFDNDHSCWLLWCGTLEDAEPIVVDSPTCSLDILPTLLNLFGVDFDSRLLPGRDVFSDAPALVFNSRYSWKTDYGYFDNSSGRFVPTVDEAQIPADYVDTMKTIVRNKISYCQAVLDVSYFTYLFNG